MWSADRRRKTGNSGATSTNVAPEQRAGEPEIGQPVVEGSLAPRLSNPLPRLAHPTPRVAGGPDLPVSDSAGSLSAVEPFAEDHAAWRAQLSAIGGKSSLLHFEDSALSRIELSTTHPGGLPQFITGQKILLSTLIRDDLALRNARIAAGRITDKAIEMRTVRGLETVHLGIGIAKWNFEGADFCGPVLLRPLAIRRYGRDFELKLKQRPYVNPALTRALYEQFGIRLDARSLLELSQASGVFKPQPVIDRLRQVVAGVADFVVQPRLVVSSFLDVAQRMLTDARSFDSPILAAICGSEPARSSLAAGYRPVSAISPNTRPPETDRHLHDADAEQDDVLAQIEAGHSLVVRTLPGTGGTQTVVNAIGALVRAGKRVLVVSPRRATLDGIAHRLSRVGLAGLAISPRVIRRNLVEAISRNEGAQQTNLRDVDDALSRLRSVLIDYQTALDSRDGRFGVAPLEAVRELTRLALADDSPTTTVRLDDVALNSLALDRSGIAEALTEVARLGQFQYGPEESPWYGVTFTTTEEARSAYSLAVKLAESELPRLISKANEVITQTSMRPYETVAELGVYLRLLMGIRETLDKFTPEVYDRSLTEVIAAHAPRSSDDMSGPNKRRLRKLAREYVRPGGHVTDMYERLTQIQQQRVLWQRYTSVVGARPEVPVGTRDVITAFQAAYQDLAELDRVLGTTAEPDRLKNVPLTDLARRVTELARPSEVLQNIQERTALVERLRAAHLEPLLDDLSARHVPAGQVAAELDQAWWQSVLERMLQTNKALLSANTGVIERLEADFRLVDDAHAGANGQVLAARLADQWRVAVLDHREEAVALRDALRAGSSSIDLLVTKAPTLMGVLAPVWAVSPYEVSMLPEDLRFDAVLLVDAGATTLVENLGAIRRAGQVVAFGDTVTQTPAPFTIAVRREAAEDEAHVGDDAALHEGSAYAQLRAVLPELSLTRSYRAGGEDLTSLVNDRFYDQQIESLPWAGSFLGHHSITHEYVRGGQGLPDQQTGAVESTDAEVERVVQLVLQHASERPRESLMVITASEKHAVRVYQSVLAAFAKYPQHRDFLLGERAEPFTVLTLEQATAQSRDRVIFSIGYGRTPHGRVLSNFGALGRPGGERLIAVAMTRARRGMTIVSCFRADDLDANRMKHGVVELAEVLALEHPDPAADALPAERDPMLGELADRLEELGLNVTLDYRGAIPLAASLGERAIAVELDYAGGEESLRDALRLRPTVLRRLGWHYHRVHSFDLFADPEQVALRIAGIIGYNADAPAEETESQDQAAAPGASQLGA
ncbi:AAA family ATPase [Leucobacter sp. CX87]|uniref:AAA family ATPase n=1 Tax=Leucobacter sp. CX87 TaxID=2813773 RepID=UPI00333EB1B1